MYYPNQSEIYKILDFRNNSVLFEGSKDELIRMIAMKYRSSFEAYQEGYFSNFSKSPYYTYYTHSIYVNWLIGHSFCGELPSEDKYYQLKDSSGRILNMKDFEEESFAFYIKNKDKNSFLDSIFRLLAIVNLNIKVNIDRNLYHILVNIAVEVGGGNLAPNISF